MQRAFSALLLMWGATVGLLCPRAMAQAIPSDLARALDEWYLRTQRVAPGLWGIAITSASGQPLWSANPDTPLAPASTAKIFTTGFARSVVGGDARLATRVMGRGHVDSASGLWIGTWMLDVNGDPTLERTARSGPMLRDLAMQLKAGGIRELRGALALTSTTGTLATAIPTAWDGRYLGRLYAPPVGAVMLHENTVGFSVRPGRSLGEPPTIAYALPDGAEALVRISARTVAGRKARLSLTSLGDGGWELGGTIGLYTRRAGASAIADRPERVLECAWAAALARAGVHWNREAPLVHAAPTDAARALAELRSAPFDSVASEVNRRSLNAGAEGLLRWASATPQAAERLTAHVRQVVGSAANVRLVDGSGLSPNDRVSPRTQALYLARLPRLKGAEAFPQLLPANGMGTLRRLGHGVLPPGVVRAKTGTLDSVSALAGYLGRRDGVLVISALYNGPRSRAAKRAEWALFRLLGAGGTNLANAASESHFGGDEAKAP